MNADNWRIEPLDVEPGPPNREDACMVCDRIDCVCPPDDNEVIFVVTGGGQ